jgi:hypothetical protein
VDGPKAVNAVIYDSYTHSGRNRVRKSKTGVSCRPRGVAEKEWCKGKNEGFSSTLVIGAHVCLHV